MAQGDMGVAGKAIHLSSRHSTSSLPPAVCRLAKCMSLCTNTMSLGGSLAKCHASSSVPPFCERRTGNLCICNWAWQHCDPSKLTRVLLIRALKSCWGMVLAQLPMCGHMV